ncbi:carboxylesterase family protein [Acanthopleuribacter pedis]|uniref:Uncharacterized protein n=1 Tax=Acanthopleuribacter pedis TaxID=442870 RepID=A0A8J7Q9D3_9BACT|nr:hypothetical protein [Acanthopleuribacter pedis]MBO1320127.1 hypothetical protein [Acanthopleuribacter pedis]
MKTTFVRPMWQIRLGWILGLLLLGPLLKAQVDPIRDSEPGALISRGQHLVYRLFVDEAATPASPRPLVVYLHGLGERGTDNERPVKRHIQPMIETLVNDPDYHGYLVVPQSSNGWWNGTAVADLAHSLLQDPGLYIDPANIVVVGISAGGSGTYEAVASGLDTFAAGVPLSAPQRTNTAAACAQRAMWLIHGNRDSQVGHSHSITMRRLMEEQGGTPRYTEVDGMGHGGWSRIFAEDPRYVGDYEGGSPADPPTEGFYDWLFAQSLAAEARPEPLSVNQTIWVELGWPDTNNNPNQETIGADAQGRLWNNFVKYQQTAFSARLHDQTGRTTSASIGIEEGFSGIFARTETVGGDLPQTAAFDGVFVGDRSGHDAALDQNGRVIIAGLTPDAPYRVAMFASASGDDYGRGRLTRATIDGLVRDVNAADNQNEWAVFEKVYADDTGRIAMTVGVAPDGGTRYAQMNALSVTALPEDEPLEPRLEEGRSLMVDFGAPTLTCPAQDGHGRFWNNVTLRQSTAANPSLENGVDDQGAATGINMVIPVGFQGYNGLGVVDDSLFPAQAQRDTFWSGSHASHEAGLTRPGQVRLTGLTPGAVYDVSLFASRQGADGDRDRLTRYTLGGHFIDFDVTDNTATTVDFDGVQAGTDGTLTLDVAVSPAGTGRYCYLGTLVLTAVDVP